MRVTKESLATEQRVLSTVTTTVSALIPNASATLGGATSSALCDSARPTCDLHGHCSDGDCQCDAGWRSKGERNDCREMIRPEDCNGHGVCGGVEDFVCQYDEGWNSTACELMTCHNDCHGEGVSTTALARATRVHGDLTAL